MQRLGMALQQFQCDPHARAEGLPAPQRLRAQHIGIGAVVGQQDGEAIGHAAQVRLIRLGAGEVGRIQQIAALLGPRAAQRDELAEIAEALAVLRQQQQARRRHGHGIGLGGLPRGGGQREAAAEDHVERIGSGGARLQHAVAVRSGIGVVGVIVEGRQGVGVVLLHVVHLIHPAHPVGGEDMDPFGLVELAVRLPRRQPAGAARHGLPHLLAQHLDGVMRARRARHRALVGQRQPAVAELECARDQFLRMRGASEEREVRYAVQLRVIGQRGQQRGEAGKRRQHRENVKNSGELR
ncbi:hypothetical protein D3C81_1165470 [compost metagenome]